MITGKIIDFSIGIPYEMYPLTFHIKVKVYHKELTYIMRYETFWRFWGYLKIYDFKYRGHVVILDETNKYKFVGHKECDESYKQWLRPLEEYDDIYPDNP